ncbi:hypothetical protein M513_12987 [Trichuris suis]|uniref:Uncharacterized protein n=2 Tax=Trichuris suis TaxID=68888 RepID=A0A085LME9_9BILA|nr:hypothetical protein M513_12987 [Trichuris suis]
MSAGRFVDMEALNRSSVLRPFADIVLNVIKNINLYPDQLVQRAAGIAVSKLMHISRASSAGKRQIQVFY